MNKITIMMNCSFCNKDHSVTVFVKDYTAWIKGTRAQDAFPYLSATKREQMISGICPKCQNDIFGEEEDADEYTGEADYDEAIAESLASTGQWW